MNSTWRFSFLYFSQVECWLSKLYAICLMPNKRCTASLCIIFAHFTDAYEFVINSIYDNITNITKFEMLPLARRFRFFFRFSYFFFVFFFKLHSIPRVCIDESYISLHIYTNLLVQCRSPCNFAAVITMAPQKFLFSYWIVIQITLKLLCD